MFTEVGLRGVVPRLTTFTSQDWMLINKCRLAVGVLSEAFAHCQKLGTRWRLRVRSKATMAANSYKKMYGDNETFSNISIISSRVFGARLETC